MANKALSMFNMKIPTTAPKSIDEIGERTFIVKERLWGWNTMRNMQHIWCKDHLGYPDLNVVDLGDYGILQSCDRCFRRFKTKLSYYADTCTGRILVVGAGPSFFDNKEKIKRWTGDIIASDRALIPLLELGIIPKFVVAADGVDHVAEYFRHPLVEKHKKGITAIFNTQIHPTTVQVWGDVDRILWFNVALDDMAQTKSLTRYLYHMTNDTVISVPWGHVGGYCIGFAVLMGYSEIAVLGIELGFKESDNVMDTPYWNPYYKAICEDITRTRFGWKELDLTKDENFNKFQEKAKSLPFDITKEYTSKTPKEEYCQEAITRTINEHFHFYNNPFGNHTYHDHIFKAYRDILFNFICGTNNIQFKQLSNYTTWYAKPCETCKGSMQVDERKEILKTCYKCNQARKEQEFVRKLPCPTCRKVVSVNEKGEPQFQSTGIMGNNIECIDIDSYINRPLETQK